MSKPMKWRGQYVDEMDRDELVEAFRQQAEEYEAELSKLRRKLAGGQNAVDSTKNM